MRSLARGAGGRAGTGCVVLAPSRSPELVRESRRLIRGRRVLRRPTAACACSASASCCRSRPARRGTPPAPPLDVARTLEEVLGHAPLDFVHVHEPFAPSTASVALRHSRALNVGTFHAPAERVISTQVARRFVERFFGRLDARTASFEATRELMERAFPAPLPGARARRRAVPAPRARDRAAELRLAFVDHEDRQALRLFLRALRRLPDDAGVARDRLHARRRAPERAAQPPARPRRGRHGRGRRPRRACSPRADIVVAASAGQAPAPGLLVRALGAGAVPGRRAAARLRGGAARRRAAGCCSSRGDADDAGRAARAAARPTPELRGRLARRASPRRRPSWPGARVADALRGALRRGRRAPAPAARRRPVRARLAARPLIDVDLHMHTDHSYDCATPVDVLLATAREQGLGAIAVTDHNEVSGALDARAKAEEYGVKVIVGEEVKTATQGEVIGLFLEEKIPRGLTLEETIAEIRAPGRARLRPAPVRPDALRARLRAPARRGRGRRRDRGLQPAHRDPGLQRGGRALRGQVPDRRRRRLGLARRAGARLGAHPDARLRRARRSSSPRSPTPTSSAARPRSTTRRCRR